MSHYRPYPAYKDSSVEWLGKVPEHWGVKKVKHSFQIVGGSTPKSDQNEFWDGDIIWVTPSDLSKLDSFFIKNSLRTISSKGLATCGATLVPPQSIILSTRAPIGSLAIAEIELCTNQGCKSLVPTLNVETKFYAYLLSINSAELNTRGKGATFLELSGDELGDFPIPSPLASEQKAIVNFLDRETARIDALVSKKTRFIELLREKRQALITHAVTKGLDPNAKMKDSGVEWLGEVPEHWNILPLKYVISEIESGTSVNATDTPAGDGEVGVLKTSSVYSGVFDARENKAVVKEEYSRVSCPLRINTLIVSRMNTPDLVGAAGLVTSAWDSIYLPDRLWQLSFYEVSPSFVYCWANSYIYRLQVKMVCSGTSSSMQNLSQEQFGSFIFVLPPSLEQEAVVAYLDRETTRIDTLISKTERSIELLKERRSALITAAVTGQIDLREMA